MRWWWMGWRVRWMIGSRFESEKFEQFFHRKVRLVEYLL
jgi:hypothetical protein